MPRFVIIGAGAVGGVIGARLFEHGQEVMLVARGDHYEAIRHDGLTLQSPDTTTNLPVPVVRELAQAAIGSEDIVILAVKSQDTIGVLTTLGGIGAWPGAVVCAQNGVDNERAALRYSPAVYGMAVQCPASHEAPGVVRAHSFPVTGILDVGRYPSGDDDLAETIAAALREATFSSEALPDIQRWKYAKLLLNLSNAVEAVCGSEVYQGSIPGQAYDEGAACLRAAGIDVATREEFAARRGDLLHLAPAAGHEYPGNSSYQSLVRGTGTIETNYLNGEIALLGRLYGIPTPVNAALQQLANSMAGQRTPPGSVSEADLLATIAAMPQ